MHRMPIAGFVLLLACVAARTFAVAPASQVAKLTALDQAAMEYFGSAVSISADVAVIGAPMDGGPGVDIGAVYVFERNAGGAAHWGQVRKLTSSDAAAHYYFGISVSISGDTIVVGNAPSGVSGSVYVFERNAGGADNWGQVRVLIPPDPAPHDFFGTSVSISGDTVVVGARHAGGSSGSAYVFVRNAIQGVGADAWQYAAKLTASDAADGDQFGSAVAISGDRAVIGAVGDDSVYVFERNAGGADSWDQVVKRTGSSVATSDGFGTSVSISGDTFVVGAPEHGAEVGSAYVYERNAGGADSWGEVAELTASDALPDMGRYFGHSVSIAGDTLVVGSHSSPYEDLNGSNATYVFVRNAGGADNWDEVVKLTAPDALIEDGFGNSVSISGDTALFGAKYDDDAGLHSGSAYIFSTLGASWAQIAKPVATDAEGGDQFGISAAISGDTAVVGATLEDPVGTNSGSAYVFARNTGGADGWDQIAKLIATDGAAGDNFGNSVSSSGDLAVVGALNANPSGAGDAGAAYLFERNVGGADHWGQLRKLTASQVHFQDLFGSAVSISVDTVVVGAYGYDGVGGSSGSAYVFERNKGGANTWGQVTQLFASDQNTGDFFGWSAAISGDTVVVGAYGNDDAGSSSGSAYVFVRNQGGPDAWGQLRKITASDAAAGALFGYAVSISGDTLVVGAVTGGGKGAAYVFERNRGGANQWGQVAKLTASDAAAGDFFGFSVSISVDTIVVGASSDDDAGSASGSAYVFERNQGGADAWGQVNKLKPFDTAADDTFGTALAIDEGAIIVGANGDDDAGSGSGSAYIFHALDPAGDPDGDGVPNASDCSAVNGGVWSIPGEARNLQLAHNRGSGVTSLSWQAPLQPGGTSLLYDAVRSGTASDFTTSWVCVLSDGLPTTANDSTAIAPGAIYFYLARGENECGVGSAGTSSPAVQRGVHDCP